MYKASHWRCALGAPVIPFLAMLINSGQWGTWLKGGPHMEVIVARLLGQTRHVRNSAWATWIVTRVFEHSNPITIIPEQPSTCMQHQAPPHEETAAT